MQLETRQRKTTTGPSSEHWGGLLNRRSELLYRRFYLKRGVIPDFHSDTESYLKIKEAYRLQSEEDHNDLIEYAKQIDGESDPTGEDFKIFCKNWFNLTVIKYRTMDEETKEINKDFVYEGEETPGWYFIFRGVDSFIKKYDRFPNPADYSALKGIVTEIMAGSQISEEEFKVNDDYIKES